MIVHKPKNLLEGITLESILTILVEHLGWAELAKKVPIKCFSDNPSMKSSLKFLRQTPWARTKVEQLYINFQEQKIGLAYGVGHRRTT